MRVSVVTPSYNQAPFLGRCLESVKRQSYSNIEHIVLDGGSTDSSLEILRRYEAGYNLKWSSRPDNGQSDAINRGFEQCTGDIVYWLNSDDAIVKQDAIERIVKEFSNRPNIDVIYGNRIVTNELDELVKLQYTNHFNYGRMLDGLLPIFQENVFFRSHVIKSQKIDESLHVVMDTEYWLRLGTAYEFAYVPEIFALFRIHATNKTVSDKYKKIWNEEKAILRKRYGAKRFKVGVGAQPMRYIHRLRVLLSGGYNNYHRILRDINDLSDSKNLSTPVRIKIDKKLDYILSSFRPYTG